MVSTSSSFSSTDFKVHIIILQALIMSNKPIVCHSLRNNTLDAIIRQCDAECKSEKMDQPIVSEGEPCDSSEDNKQVVDE